jgi:lysophospholipase L1-like esterase
MPAAGGRIGGMNWRLVSVVVMALGSASAPGQAVGDAGGVVDARGFEVRKGDMVVLLGGTFFERDYEFGHIETALSQAFPDFGLRFRNLGWSADTVWGTSRSYFGPPSEGLDRLRGHLQEIKPTVVVCQYGAAEAWDGRAKIDAFLDGYRRLLELVKSTAAEARVVLVSPLPAEPDPSLPALDAYNRDVAEYRDAVRRLAAERSLPFIDAFLLGAARPADAPRLTTNGLHFTEAGYRQLAALVPAVVGGGGGSRPVDEKLRALILEKNRLFFHRWRPANETYLFGFRKHEQGRNAAEIPLFDPLIEAKEKEIAALLTPRG